jgi:hypothetical protein
LESEEGGWVSSASGRHVKPELLRKLQPPDARTAPKVETAPKVRTAPKVGTVPKAIAVPKVGTVPRAIPVPKVRTAPKSQSARVSTFRGLNRTEAQKQTRNLDAGHLASSASRCRVSRATGTL